jgi:hypothetical protein
MENNEEMKRMEGELSVSITGVPWSQVCWDGNCAEKPAAWCPHCGIPLCSEHLKEHLAHEGEEVIRMNDKNLEEKQEEPGKQLGLGIYYVRKFVSWIREKMNAKKPQE